ncbi:MAG: bicyclomycin resistance protein, partial [Betaproteobacteria bacterium]
MHGRRGFLAGAGALGSVPLAARAQARRQDARADAPRTLRYPFEIAETTFDPAAIQDGYSRQITGHIFEA